MRIAYYGNFDESWNTESYVLRALRRAGCEVQPIQECEQEELLARLEPADVFLFAKGRVGGEWNGSPGPTLLQLFPQIRQRCKKVVCWIWELLHPDFSPQRFQWAGIVSSAVDLFCTSDGATAPWLFNCKVLRQGIGDDVRQGVYREELACDILFLGNPYGPRRAWLESLQRHFHRRLWAIPSGYRGDILNDVMASSKIVIAPPWPHFEGYWSNRCYVVAGYGGRLIQPICQYIEKGLVWAYYDPEDAVTRLEELLLGNKHPALASVIQLVTAPHTYDHRVRNLLEWVS